MSSLLRVLSFTVVLPIIVFLTLLVRKQRKELIWGPDPIINNKYWSSAMAQAGWESRTLMTNYYPNNKREDYDLYFEDLGPRWLWPRRLRVKAGPYLAFLYTIRNARAMHLSFAGGPLGKTPMWRIEAHLYHLAGIPVVVIPYGGDVYMYSRIIDLSLKNGLLLSYPAPAREERQIANRVRCWSKAGDFVFTGFTVDGLGRWDIPLGNMVCIDTAEWKSKTTYSSNDGRAGVVKVLHAPNHRGFKGTEFLLQAVEELQAEGLDIELVLLEQTPNDEVRVAMQEADLLADQFIFTGYGLASIEGMASGLPVLSNLDNEMYTKVFRRYSFLNECPILSASPERLKQNLRVLITEPELRKELGQAGRAFIEKYHSYETAQYLFGSIYDKIIYGKDVDLMNLFHPLKSEYNRRKPYVNHPLTENQLLREALERVP